MTETQLLSKWQYVLAECAHIPTWTAPAELALCAEIASRCEYALELGTFHGASALVMLRANPKLHLWCCDIFTAYAFNKEIAAYFLRKEIHEGRCELIVGDSRRAADMLVHMKGKLDGVWCDDGHAEEDLIRDITCCLPLLKSGKIMWGHDWDGDNNVARGVKATGIKYFLPLPRIWAAVKE